MNGTIEILVTFIVTFAASSGFWAFLQSRNTKKSATTRLLMGLALEKIIGQGTEYIERGWVSRDEYDDYQRYLFGPYKELGGNGTADKIMFDVKKIPAFSRKKAVEFSFDILKQERTQNDRYETKYLEQ